MVRIDVTLNVTLTDSPCSDGMTRLARRARIQSNMRVWHRNWCRCVDMIRTACGGADSLSHPGARGGLDARLGASLDPRNDVSSRIPS